MFDAGTILRNRANLLKSANASPEEQAEAWREGSEVLAVGTAHQRAADLLEERLKKAEKKAERFSKMAASLHEIAKSVVSPGNTPDYSRNLYQAVVVVAYQATATAWQEAADIVQDVEKKLDLYYRTRDHHHVKRLQYNLKTNLCARK